VWDARTGRRRVLGDCGDGGVWSLTLARATVGYLCITETMSIQERQVIAVGPGPKKL